ncbi:sensor histidine kinase [Oceanospirillum beijerinckii]|uniref:sensor histidine kinase n=1 Tax=Oceanospirillum beijerinckii TaxID=64976 RepID=UPI000406937F|nr:HAMP domain-containing sensor histidine kinase [Oceanospirillum beijerinckii]
MIKLDSAAWSLISLVLIPIVVISALGIKALNNEKASRQLEQQALLEYQLNRFTQRIDHRLRDALKQWHQRIELIEYSSDRLRELILSRQGVDLITITSHAGQRIFPPEKSVGALFAEKVLLRQYQTQFNALTQQALISQQQQLDTTTFASTDTKGQILLNCWSPSGKKQNSYCVLLSAQWLEDELSRIVFQEQEQEQHTSLSLSLVQTASVSKTAEKKTSVSKAISQPLMPPFEAWSLRYSEPKHPERSSALLPDNQSLYPAYIAVLSPIYILFMALAIQLYLKHREQQQQLKLRTTYTAQLAHEFRTPLTNLRLYSSLLRDEASKDEREHFCDVLEMECQRLSNLVDNAIMLASPAADSATALVSTIPNLTITEAVKSFQPALSSENIKVTTDLATPETVAFNQLALQCVLNNLLDNATKYAAGSLVFIRSEFKQQMLVIQFTDTGPGIPTESISHIFQPYQNSKAREKGFGLGLSVCHRLVHRAGGEVRLLKPVTSDNSHKHTKQGTRFEITLPYQPLQQE